MTAYWCETPSGTCNGSNVTFTFANTPATGMYQVFINGLLCEVTTDYSVTGTTITFVLPPLAGDRVRVNYRTS